MKLLLFFIRKMKSTDTWFPRVASVSSTLLCLKVVLLFSDCLEKPICPTVLTGGIRDMSLKSRIRSTVAPAGPSAQYVLCTHITWCPLLCRTFYTTVFWFHLTKFSFRLARWRVRSSGRQGSLCLWASSSWWTAPVTMEIMVVMEDWWTTLLSTLKPTEG